jgi:hypothetical protein
MFASSGVSVVYQWCISGVSVVYQWHWRSPSAYHWQNMCSIAAVCCVCVRAWGSDAQLDDVGAVSIHTYIPTCMHTYVNDFCL